MLEKTFIHASPCLNSKESVRAESALNHQDRITRSADNHTWYSTTFQTSHFVPQTQSPKFLLSTRTKMTFPTLYFFLGILNSGQDTQCHRNTFRQGSILFFLSIYSCTSHTDTHRHTPLTCSCEHSLHPREMTVKEKQLKVLNLNMFIYI